MSTYNITFGNLIAVLRKRAKMTQAEMSERVIELTGDKDFYQYVISMIERGEFPARGTTTDALRAYAEILGCEYQDLKKSLSDTKKAYNEEAATLRINSNGKGSQPDFGPLPDIDELPPEAFEYSNSDLVLDPMIEKVVTEDHARDYAEMLGDSNAAAAGIIYALLALKESVDRLANAWSE